MDARQESERDEGNVSNTADDVSGVVFQVRDVKGDATMNISSREPRSRPIALPVRFGQVPLLAAGFQERLVAADVSQALADEHTVVISGLGGVGKTQLAAAHATRVWNAGEADLLVWITAVTRRQLVTNFASLAYDLTGIDDGDPERGARRLLDWLAGTQWRWLVVLDDVQAPSDLDDLWPSHTSTGRIVVTTRRRDAILNGHGRRLVEVSLFTCEESLAYLEGRLSGHRHLLDGAGELVRNLGHLPLAGCFAHG